MLTIFGGIAAIGLLYAGPAQAPVWTPFATLLVGLAIDTLADSIGFYRLLRFKNPLPLRNKD